MASKFAKEEQVFYSPANSDSESEDEPNNSKANASRSSPSHVEEQIHNNFSGRSGGPCSPQDYLGSCGHCGANNRVDFTCGDYIYLCSNCFSHYYTTCPRHPSCYRKINGDNLGSCEHCTFPFTKSYVEFTCEDYVYLCSDCYKNYYQVCPREGHSNSRKTRYL